MQKKYFTLLLLFCSIFFFGQKYVSTVDNLNVREFANQNSDIKGKLMKGEEIEVLQISNDWAKIKYQTNEYYVSSKFLSNESKEVKDLGFKEGFLRTFLYSAIFLALLLTAPEVFKRRVNDRRFRQGIRQDKVPETIMWKNFFIAALIAIPIGLIGGIIYWIL